MAVPSIKTAIPKRRYQLGEFLITILGEVQSGDDVDYRYIMAVARESDPHPRLFVNAESGGEEGLLLRVAMADGSREVGRSERWRDLDTFVQDGLDIVSRMLSLSDERPFRLA